MTPILHRAAGILLMLTAFHSHVWAGGGQWTLTARNNLGMHCMDDDCSVFSILPPFNTVNAQLIDQAGKLVINPAAAGITLTYRPPDATPVIEVAGDLQSWFPAMVLTGPAGELAARDTVSREAATRRFIRLRVVRPAPGP